MKNTPTCSQRQRGFNLVELMTALLIGLLLMAGLSTMFVTTKRNYTAQDSMSRLQENGRIAMQIMSREIRAAGFFGCASTVDSVNNRLVGGASSFGPYGHRVPLQGSDNGSGLLFPGSEALPAGAITDAISIRYADGKGAFAISSEMPSPAANMDIVVGSAAGVAVGDILFVSDCKTADIFQVTGPANDPVDWNRVVHNSGSGTPGNTDGSLSKPYGPDAEILKFVQVTYFIAPSATSGQPALWRSVFGVPVELIDGIEAMEILYGVDTDGDPLGLPDRFLKAGQVGPPALITIADWQNVRSVRIGIVARALANKTVSTDKAKTRTAGEADVTPPELINIDIDGDGNTDLDISTLTAADQPYQRRVFRSTLQLRNL